MGSLVGKYVIITLIDGRKLHGKIVEEDQYTISLKEGPNPDYSHKPPMVVMRNMVVTIEVK